MRVHIFHGFCLSFFVQVSQMCLARPQKLCNFLEWREYKLIYKRYASLFFITCGMLPF